jgi:phosphoenolpyruvate carboxykinase (ATP)
MLRQDVLAGPRVRAEHLQDYLLILNWNENIIPAVARLSQAQAAAYFMLGETTGTSAGGKAEEGRFLRVPGTNPFFPLKHGLQGNRFLELLDTHPMEVYLMNTGRVGGKEDDDRSKKVKIPVSSSVVEAIAEQTIKWTGDADFGYEIAEDVPGIDDPELLQPRRLYERQGRMDEFTGFVEQFKRERAQELAKYPELTEEIVRAVS